jgi:hypothetical protein
MTQLGDARQSDAWQHRRPGRHRRAELREVPATDQAIRVGAPAAGHDLPVADEQTPAARRLDVPGGTR